MKKLFLIIFIFISLTACKKKNTATKKTDLTETVKTKLIAELKIMEELYELNRSYTFLKTFNKKLIDSVNNLSMTASIKFTRSYKAQISKKTVRFTPDNSK
jgi:hypothetical protein